MACSSLGGFVAAHSLLLYCMWACLGERERVAGSAPSGAGNTGPACAYLLACSFYPIHCSWQSASAKSAATLYLCMHAVWPHCTVCLQVPAVMLLDVTSPDLPTARLEHKAHLTLNDFDKITLQEVRGRADRAAGALADRLSLVYTCSIASSRSRARLHICCHAAPGT